ncbi:MAG: Gfo/Idh/MocA family oxidoreductase [Oligoflexia bacterium]|nr:Gfo/Idh/MocA family oxidoreductase [Oligoflexia bacterium]
MGKKVRLGIIGASNIAKQVIPLFSAVPGLELSAIAARSLARAKKIAHNVDGVNYYGNYYDLLSDDRIDAVYITLPNALHFRWAKLALLAKKHVLCEKPIVLKQSHLYELKEIAGKQSLVLMEAMWYRFHPLIDSIRESVQGGDIGTVQAFHSTLGFQNPKNNIRWSRKLGGGALNDLFCYHLDAITYIMNQRVSMLRKGVISCCKKRGVIASLAGELSFNSDCYALLASSIENKWENRTTIVGSKGSISVPNLLVFPLLSEAVYRISTADGCVSRKFNEFNAYEEMFRAFVEMIHGERNHDFLLNNSLETIKLLEYVNQLCHEKLLPRAFIQKIIRKVTFHVNKVLYGQNC